MYSFTIKQSKIEGVGLFADTFIPSGTNLFRIGWFNKVYHQDFIGQFFNHSQDPNIEMFLDGENIYARTLKPVKPRDELLDNYAVTQKKLNAAGCKCNFLEFFSHPEIYSYGNRLVKRSFLHIGTRVFMK